LSDADAVTEDMDQLAVIYAAGDSAGSITQSVTLSAAGSNGTTITWASDNTTVIAINGIVSRPTYNDGEDASVMVTLTATITKNGESDSKTFTLNVKKISTSTTLSGLTVSKGVLQPAFNSSITTYLDAPVPFSDSAAPAYNDTQSASITATATNSAATITINSNAVTSGSAYTMNNLAVGANTATIVVTAEDGVTNATYVVTVYRAIPVFKTGAGAISGYTLDSREDGATQLGVSWPATRFSENGNSTLTDNMTGLVWTKSASMQNTWVNGIAYCEGLTTDGSDWRMPNVRELWSIMHFGQSLPDYWLKDQGFLSLPADYFWTGTTLMQNTIVARTVRFNPAYITSLNKTPTTGGRYVLAVFSESMNIPVTGQSVEYSSGDDGTYQTGVNFPSIRFRDNGDGTITDNMTGLMWLINANNAGGVMTWNNALTYVAGLNEGTNSGNCSYNDWRLPSVNDLETLINYSQSELYTWLNDQGFANVQNNYYWTSTTYAPNNSNVWSVWIYDCTTLNRYKTSNSYIWPVRGPVQ
jgi:hypothetical protein